MFLNNPQKLNQNGADNLNVSHSATPQNKRSATVRSNSQNPKDSSRKERHNHVSGSQSKTHKHGDHSTTKKKNTFSNFMSNTQKLSREELLQSDRNHSFR